ncbi:MAG TPA: glycosyltransferase family 4 protein [Patescibacteria group bacterium]|nr:glycosyltransferase family 4 protein [Patescibacteria group bacterium]
MKILQLCAVDFTAYHLLRPLGAALREAGHEVAFCCSPGEGLDLLREEGFRVHPVPIVRSYNLPSHFRSLVSLVRLFRRERFDVVHTHTPVAGLIGRVAARIAAVPHVVYTAHGFYFHEAMNRNVRRFFIRLERFGGRLSDIVFVQSEEDWREAHREGVAPPGRLIYIGNGVDPTRFGRERYTRENAALRGEFHLGEGPVVGFVGRIVREKGAVEFVEAAASVRRVVSRARFIMVGQPLPSDRDGCWREIQALREKLDLCGVLELTGYRRDVPAILSLFDLFVLPSYREGMPRALLEAMATGIPVVATDIRGCREEVVDGETGLLVPPRDPEALAAAITRLLADPPRADAMGAAGRARVLDRFDERRITRLQVDRIERLYRGQAVEEA